MISITECDFVGIQKLHMVGVGACPPRSLKETKEEEEGAKNGKGFLKMYRDSSVVCGVSMQDEPRTQRNHNHI